MPWYKLKKDSLDYTKPIIAESETDKKYLLLPQMMEKQDYRIKGYNWFDVEDGSYNSAKFYETAELAVNAYSDGYVIYNCELTLKRL